MAITKIHAIKATVGKAVEYICNPHKTDDRILIDFFGTGPETAEYDFKMALSKTDSSDPSMAFHLIQSFAPGEVNPEEAHKIGTELADTLLEGRYSYVVTTHIDRGHIHNHLIFCAADNIDFHKYHDCKESYRYIRKLSDEICLDHDLSVIKPGQKRGMDYKEWFEIGNRNSWKDTLKKDIDQCICTAKSYDEFCTALRSKGYEIKGTKTDGSDGKYIAFKPVGRTQFVRGSERSLGGEYTRESIIKRIEEEWEFDTTKEKTDHSKQSDANSQNTANKAGTISGNNINNEAPATEKTDIPKYTPGGLINTESQKYVDSPGLKNWAELHNLQDVAKTYAEAGSLTELSQIIASKKALVKNTKASLIALEKKLKTAGEILKYSQQYTDCKKFADRLKTSKDSDRYFREHDAQITLFNAAETYLCNMGINPKKVDVAYMKEAFQKMAEQKEKLYSNLLSERKEIDHLEKNKQKIEEYVSPIKTRSMDIEHTR